MNTNDMTRKVIEADNFASHHSVSAPVINKFVLSLSGSHYSTAYIQENI